MDDLAVEHPPMRSAAERRRARPGASAPGPVRPALGAGRGARRRLVRHHVPVAVASSVATLLFLYVWPFTSSDRHTRSFTLQLTAATGYVPLGLLALTLLIGPANLLLRRRNPVSSYLRRDLGMWAAIASVVHVIPGLQVHSTNRGVFSFVDYFVSDGRPLTNDFGLANWTGLVGLVIVLGLLAISTDRSLRQLRAKRWKSLQRLNYTLFALVFLHAFYYGALSRTTSPFALLLIVTTISVLAAQAVGIRLWRRTQAPRIELLEHKTS